MHTLELFLSPEIAASDELIRQAAAQRLSVSVDKISGIRYQKRSIDARQKPVRIRLVMDVYIEEALPEENPTVYLKLAKSPKTVVIIGLGPAGAFAALRLLEL